MSQLELTPADRLVLQSYASTLDGLAAYLGNQYELVLYSLEDTGRSVIKIVNGQYTGREAGAPISGMAMSILEHFKDDGGYVSYTTDSRHGEKLKFIAIAIRGEQQRIIGLLCVNAYLNTPQQDVLAYHFENPATLSQLSVEKMAGDPEKLIREAALAEKERVEADPTVLPSLRNKEVVFRLKEQGIFRLKNAVVQVAELLGISKNTVYMHLRNASHQE